MKPRFGSLRRINRAAQRAGFDSIEDRKYLLGGEAVQQELGAGNNDLRVSAKQVERFFTMLTGEPLDEYDQGTRRMDSMRAVDPLARAIFELGKPSAGMEQIRLNAEQFRLLDLYIQILEQSLFDLDFGNLRQQDLAFLFNGLAKVTHERGPYAPYLTPPDYPKVNTMLDRVYDRAQVMPHTELIHESIEFVAEKLRREHRDHIHGPSLPYLAKSVMIANHALTATHGTALSMEELLQESNSGQLAGSRVYMFSK